VTSLDSFQFEKLEQEEYENYNCAFCKKIEVEEGQESSA